MNNEDSFSKIANTLSKQAAQKAHEQKYAHVKEVLKLVAGGFFLASAFVAPNLPKALAPLFDSNEKDIWKRYNIPYIKRALYRLEKQKLIEISEENGIQIAKLTANGKTRILKLCLEELDLEKPGDWDGIWRIVMYDIPRKLTFKRQVFKGYLDKWNFYPLQESVLLHAYPCEDIIDFLRNYYGLTRYVRIVRTREIENADLFREFFNI